MVDIDEDDLRKRVGANDVFDIGGANGERVLPRLELTLHVGCTEADVIMFHSRP